jgi:hypothetical protein
LICINESAGRSIEMREPINRLHLRKQEPASIRGSSSLIAPGQWDLVLEGDAAGRRMFLSKNRVIDVGEA